MFLISPCHSFILDLDDENCQGVFNEEEMNELLSYGKATIRTIDQEKLVSELDKMEDLVRLASDSFLNLHYFIFINMLN